MCLISRWHIRELRLKLSKCEWRCGYGYCRNRRKVELVPNIQLKDAKSLSLYRLDTKIPYI
jgi:hypothetical protein